jgi:hypothetical protein
MLCFGLKTQYLELVQGTVLSVVGTLYNEIGGTAGERKRRKPNAETQSPQRRTNREKNREREKEKRVL